jgi:hypothetical protein
MAHTLSDLELREINDAQVRTQHTKPALDKSEWFRFGQQRHWLPPIERVCGSQREVDVMKHSHSFSGSSPSLLKQSWHIVGAAFMANAAALMVRL